MKKEVRCPLSGDEETMLTWLPEPGYNGAVICRACQMGVEVVKGTVVKAVSESGHEGFSGRVKVHYVDADWLEDYEQRQRRENGK